MDKNEGKVISWKSPVKAKKEYIPLCKRMDGGKWPCPEICGEMCVNWCTDRCLNKEKDNDK